MMKLYFYFIIMKVQFEISGHNGNYFVFDVNDFIYENSFTCAVENKINNINNLNQPESSVSIPMCLEVAIEIDYYTRNTLVLILQHRIGQVQ